MKILRFASLIALLFVQNAVFALGIQEPKPTTSPIKILKVAIYPWSFAENERGTSEKGVERVKSLLAKSFEERGGMEVISPALLAAAWKQLNGQTWTSLVEDPKDLPKLPDSKTLLEFGKLVGADYVCAGNVEWSVKSKWGGLGPKTRVTAFSDIKVIDVVKSEECLNVVHFGSNTGAAEQWWQSAGSLLLTWGFTVFSGGPKTPHIERSGILAVGGGIEPFFTSLKSKIK